MRPIRLVTQDEVWEHWQRVENHASPDFRRDIRDAMPSDLQWTLCEVEQHDVDRLFIISSEDWSDISGGSFRAADVEARLDLPTKQQDTLRIANSIRGTINYLKSGGQLDSQLIAITDNPSLLGPFTLMEGNHRCVAFIRCGILTGRSFFVGYSPATTACLWTRHTYGSR